jgi:hypothetical protein
MQVKMISRDGTAIGYLGINAVVVTYGARGREHHDLFGRNKRVAYAVIRKRCGYAESQKVVFWVAAIEEVVLSCPCLHVIVK